MATPTRSVRTTIAHTHVQRLYAELTMSVRHAVSKLFDAIDLRLTPFGTNVSVRASAYGDLFDSCCCRLCEDWQEHVSHTVMCTALRLPENPVVRGAVGVAHFALNIARR